LNTTPIQIPLLPSETSDNYFLRLAFSLKSTISHPIQSLFRVFALITFRDDTIPKDKITYVTGTNSECCFVSNNICAERSALVQLRNRKGCHVLQVFIASDSQEFITPGMLCREFMMDNFCDENTLVTTCGENKVPRTFTLGELFPFPSLYLTHDRDHVSVVARQLAKQSQSPPEFFTKHGKPQSWTQLYHQLIQYLAKDCNATILHPISYAAGVLFESTEIVMVSHHVGIEYGCSLDAVSRLTPYMENHRDIGDKAVVILQCDQFGLLHAPCSVARAYLHERGFVAVRVVVHMKEGELMECMAGELSPHSPKVEELFKKAAKL